MFRTVMAPVVLLSLLMLAACQTSVPTVGGIPFKDDPMFNIEAVWNTASIQTSKSLGTKIPAIFSVLPDKEAKAAGMNDGDAKMALLSKHLKGQKVPVLVMLHGCAGVLTNDVDINADIVWKTKLDMITIRPDSFARSRPLACNPNSHSVTYFYERSDYFRLAELTYILDKLRQQDWVGNIMIMGHSQGASVVSEYDNKHNISGRVIYSGSCNGFNGFGSRGSIKDDEKIYVIHSNNDPWKGCANGICTSRGNPANRTVDETNEPTHNLLMRDAHLDKLINWLDTNL